MVGCLSSRYFFCSNYFSNNTYLMFIQYTVNQCFSVLLLIITMIYFDDVIVEYNIKIKDFFLFFNQGKALKNFKPGGKLVNIYILKEYTWYTTKKDLCQKWVSIRGSVNVYKRA